jgi:anthranilate phosphoribosyltransferase
MPAYVASIGGNLLRLCPIVSPGDEYVGSARSSLGVPTIFNLLGPLTNPARARHQLLGVFSPELTDRLASVLRELGSQRAWVVHAEDGLDELSTIGRTRVTELHHGEVRTFFVDPKDHALAYARLSDLQVQSVDESAAVIRSVLNGEKGSPRDICLLNAAAALVIAEVSPDLKSGLERAAHSIDSGAARRSLETLIACSQE